MKLFGSSFGRTPKHRKFSYKSRYSDERETQYGNQKPGGFNFRSSSKVLGSGLSSRQSRRTMRWSDRTGKHRNRGRYRLMLLLAIFGVIFAYYKFDLNGILAVFLIFLLLILFIRENNRT